MKIRKLKTKSSGFCLSFFACFLMIFLFIFVYSLKTLEHDYIFRRFQAEFEDRSNGTCFIRQCTNEEKERNGEFFASFQSDWSSCYSDLYLMAFDYDDKDTYTMIDVGANKAYAVAAWLAFFLSELEINRANLHEYLESTGEVGYACGSCADCKAKSFTQTNIRQKLKLHLHAFEPQPSTAYLLKGVRTWMNVSARSKSTFDVYQMAISK